MSRIGNYISLEFLNLSHPCVDEYYIDYIFGLRRVQKALFEFRGKFFTLDQCGDIWQSYSWSLSASWLFLPDNNEDIVKQIESMYDFTNYEELLFDYKHPLP